jgi:hypothetical protein
MIKKDWAKYIVVFIITVGAVLWSLNYLFLSGKTAPKSKASGETIEISYDPAAPTVAAGSDVTVMVKMKPSANIALRGYTLKLKFDKAVLQAKYIDYKLGVPSPEFGDTSGTLTGINQTGTINVQGEIQNSTGLILNGGSTVDLVRLVFKATTAAGNTVDVSNANFFIVQSDGTIETNFISAVADLKINGGTASATCTTFADNFDATTLNQNRWTAPTSNNGNVSLAGGNLVVTVPASTDTLSKNTFTSTKQTIAGNFEAVAVLESLSSNPASSSGNLSGLGFYGDPFDGFAIERLNNGQLKVLFDWNNSDWVTPTVVSTSLAASSPVKVRIKRTNALLEFHYDLMDGGGYRLAKSFSGGYTGSGTLSLYAKNSTPNYPATNAKFDNFSLTCAAAGVTPTVSTTPNLSPTSGVTPTGTIPVTGNTILNLKLKFQGIPAKPADARNAMNVRFTLSGDGITTPLVKSGTFVSDANGIWSGKVGFDIAAPAGKKYILYVKGPRHVQKKICEISPAETAAGTYRCATEAITLAIGQNTFDFSKVLLLSGDVYGPDKTQDGVVNAVDISYVKNNLRKTEAAILSICDINLDGKCDTQDYSLIISALSIKSDEL